MMSIIVFVTGWIATGLVIGLHVGWHTAKGSIGFILLREGLRRDVVDVMLDDLASTAGDGARYDRPTGRTRQEFGMPWRDCAGTSDHEG